MNRGDFLWLVAAAPASVLVAAADITIPVELRAGRLFAVPRTLDGRTFACWLDTDGGGFIFASAVKDFRLKTYSAKGVGVAELPRFAEGRGIPPLAVGSALEVFSRPPTDRPDPILSGFDAQLGATWFARRVWRFDFRRGTLAMLAAPIPPNSGLAIAVEHGYPSLPVRIADDPGEVAMSFDIAASVAVRAPARDSDVRATSFVRRETFDRWHADHRDWSVSRDIGAEPGIDEIVVPFVRVGATIFSNVAFTTRPADDVFENDAAKGKLGANAYADCVVLVDYPNARIQFSRD